MEWKSIHFNGNSWLAFRLGEQALLLRPDIIDETIIEFIRNTARSIESAKIDGIVDVIPAYESLTLIFSSSELIMMDTIADLIEEKVSTKNSSYKTYEVPVCYEFGLDWLEIEEHIGLAKEEVIKIHSSKTYTIAMMGFLPGFIFLEGMDKKIQVPRKKSPRIEIPKGSIGIGGSQTGIYSLESPGGWQIIGKTPLSFFSISENPPISVEAGDRIKFIPISEEEFSLVGAKHG
jgi:KipI family sensor histidine kinase inhibitor